MNYIYLMKTTLPIIRILMFLLIFSSGIAFCQKQPQVKTSQNLIQFVNPLIGTGGHGHTFPGPTMPFGACQPGPDTRLSGWDGCSGYHYSDTVIYGFSQTHLSGTGVSDYGDVLIMPVTKPMSLTEYAYASSFSHKTETVKAGYYSVLLNDHQIFAEITPTLHGGFYRFSYPKAADQYMVLDLKHRDQLLDSRMKQVDEYTIEGYRFSKAWAKEQKVFYRITFSQKIKGIEYEAIASGSQTISIPLEKSPRCLIKFEKNTGNITDTLQAKICISGVDENGASKNMLAEMPHWNFNRYRLKAELAWQSELSKIEVQPSSVQTAEMATADMLTIFYTALYHCMTHPSLYNDVDGRYRGRDDKIHQTHGKFNYYTIFSLWDTYRGLHPLLSLLDPKRTSDFIQTFIAQYEQGGRLPIWELSSNETNCMIGYHVVSVIWDAYQRGIRNYDVQKAFEAMQSIATSASDYTGDGLTLSMKAASRLRCADADALESYCKYGYVRADDAHESVSKTLEYAYNDWCIAHMAKALKKDEAYRYYQKRSCHWMNSFDPETQFMRARKNGAPYVPFSPYSVDNNFTEANSWQYSFYVPHHPKAMMNAYGGLQKFEQKLNDLFQARTETEGRQQADITGLIGQYAHGNEPSHHIAFLYNLVGRYDKTDSIVQQIWKNFYRNDPDGLIGNEDCGQMSAWYVLTALGMYPTCPGNGYMDRCKPLYDSYTLLGKKVSVKSVAQHQYEPRIPHSSWLKPQIVLHYPVLQEKTLSTPQTKITTSKESVEDLQTCIPAPYSTATNRSFVDTMSVGFASMNSNDTIYYRANDEPFQTYLGQPILLSASTNMQFFSRHHRMVSAIQTSTYTRIPNDKTVILKSVYNKSYSAGGANALIDGIYGKENWRAGDWQGYQGQDVEIIIALNEPKKLTQIGAHFLEDQNSWIFYPKSVSFYVSDDSTNWNHIETIPSQASDHNEEVTTNRFTTKQQPAQSTKYIKVIARNFGPMPQWHEGRGNETFIFIDEVEFR